MLKFSFQILKNPINIKIDWYFSNKIKMEEKKSFELKFNFFIFKLIYKYFKNK